MKKQPKKFVQPKKKDSKSSTPAAKATVSKESPSISRSIPEKKSLFRSSLNMTSWGVLVVSFLTGGLLMANVLLGVSVLDHAKELSAKEAIRTQLLSEKLYWEGVVSKYPDYKDAQFQLALRLYQLGERENAQMTLDRVITLDPQENDARELLKKL